MPGFIRQKAALPHRETLPSKTPVTQSAPAAPSKKRSALTDLTSSSAEAVSKKRPSPSSLSSPSCESTTNTAKKARITSPLPSESATLAPNSPPHAESLPSSLPANTSDYLHDPSGLLPQLMDSYNVSTMQIISSSKMSTKIARSLDTLILGKINIADRTCKPGLVVMYAKAPVAGKLISCVEVVKREVAGKGEKWYQYNALEETMIIIPRKKSGKKDDAKDRNKDEEGDEDAYFETMKTKQERLAEGTDRIRAVPVLTVYLSRVPIEKLKQKYGEQTNAKR